MRRAHNLRAGGEGLVRPKAVFIDRDDTIAQDVPYCSRPEDLRLFPGVGGSIRKLNEAGYLTVLVTNQSGIGRGYFDAETLERIHDKLRMDLQDEGARLDAIYFCPHRPDEGCGCRKPATGMLERAVRDLGIDLRSSYVIGERENDVAMGRVAMQVHPGHRGRGLQQGGAGGPGRGLT